ncbi:MAG: ANTAR domain-containing protein [Actinomycetes bacterium]
MTRTTPSLAVPALAKPSPATTPLRHAAPDAAASGAATLLCEETIEQWRREWAALLEEPSDGEGAPSPDGLRAYLEAAHEELVAQQQAVDDLLQSVTRQRLLVARLDAAVPIPVLVTDPAGLIHEANAAASAVLGVHPLHLTRKPLLTYVDPADRGGLRNALASLAPGTPTRTSFRLVPRVGEPREVEATLVYDRTDDVEPDGLPQVRWVMAGPTQAHVPDFVVELVRAAGRAETVPQLLLDVVSLVVTHLPDVDDMVLCLGDPRRPEQLQASSAEATAMAVLQQRALCGPLVAGASEVTVSEDVSRDPRWPALTLAHPSARAVAAVPLPPSVGVPGVLALHCLALPADATALVANAELVAEVVATLVRDRRELDDLRTLSAQLREALTSRAVIDQAKGIVMALQGCDAEEAFRRLAVMSQRRNVKLRLIAEELVHQVQSVRPTAGTREKG